VRSAIISAIHRVLYVDGFNFYYGVTRFWNHEMRLPGLGWCDFSRLIERHFPGLGQVHTKYFTAFPTVELPSHRMGERECYLLWRRALQPIDNLLIVDGFYKPDDDKRNLDLRSKRRIEKQTDVNLAVEMMVDAFSAPDSRPEEVFILSGDCDQMPAVFALQERAPVPIRVTLLLHSDANRRVWQKSYERTRRRLLKGHPRVSRNAPGVPVAVHVLDETMLATVLLRYTLHDSEGTFECPDYWRLPADYLEKHCRNTTENLDESPARRGRTT
jgi:hypothetical protein